MDILRVLMVTEKYGHFFVNLISKFVKHGFIKLGNNLVLYGLDIILAAGMFKRQQL